MRKQGFIFVNRFFAPDHSATSQILSDLAFYLAARGKNVAVITSRGLYDNLTIDLPAVETINGVEIYRVCKPRFGRNSIIGRTIDYLTMYHAFAMAVWRLAKRGDCLIAKTDPPLLSVALAPVARSKGLSLINWLQDLYPEIALRLGVRAFAPVAPAFIAARNASLKQAALNVVIGERMQDRLESLGVGRQCIETIPNWCDDERITPRSNDENELRTAWALQGKFVVGYSGNLGRAHEYDTLLAAAEQIRGESDIVFLFVGGGYLTNALKSDVARRGLARMFQFRPYQDAALLPLSLTVPDIHWISLKPAMEGLIVPSKFYGIAAAGRPVIAVTDPEGEIARLVSHHDCGAVVAPGDATGLAASIMTMKNDPQRLARTGRNARGLLETHFRKQQALQCWDQLLDKVWEN